MNRPDKPSMAVEPTGSGRHGHGDLVEKESSCDDLLERILDRDNLIAAWKRVKQNRGAAGVDGMRISDFRDFLVEHWEMIRQKLMEGTYRPSPVRRVEIPKSDGTKRPLGIPTVLDRVIQQAIAQILTPIYDPTFSESSHGFRPGRSAHDAIRAVQITSRYPAVHGAPVHLGLPEQIGISDLSQPDFGDAVEVHADELPVFWACGVTPQSVAMSARPPLMITHSPGCMFVTDVRDESLAVG